VVISELYKAGKAKQEALGVLAKTVICAKTGCLASGPEVVVGNVTLQLTDAVAPAPRPKPAKETRQEKLPPRQPQPKPEKPPSPQPPKPQGPSRTTPLKEPQKKEVGEAKKEEASWDRLVSLLAEETKIERTKAESILNTIFNYLATYPSAGVLRFIDDVARMSKADQRTVRTALEILRSSDVVEMREEGVVNLKRAVRREGLPL
jgi:type IV secretory pathway VirB10-like protein